MVAVLWTLLGYPETGGYAIEDIHKLFEGNIMKQSIKDNRYIISRKPRQTAVQQLQAQQANDADSIRSFKPNEERYERPHV
jgi:hypothetical protein